MVSDLHKIGANRNQGPLNLNIFIQISVTIFTDLLNFRLMMDGGLENAMVNLGYSLQTMLKSSSNRQDQQLGQSGSSLPLIS